MATHPFVATDVPLQIGEDNWECWCSSIELTPDQTMTDVTPLCSDDVRQLPGPITWTLDISYYQDWTSADALADPPQQDGISEWLFDHWGEEMPFAIGPAQPGGAVITGTCKIVAGPFGASSGDVAEGSVSLPAWDVQKIPGAAVVSAGLHKGTDWRAWRAANATTTLTPGAKASASASAPISRSRSGRVTATTSPVVAVAGSSE